MPMTKRMEQLKKRLFEIEFHTPKTWFFKDTNILNEWPEIMSEPMVVRKAYAQKYIGEFLPVVITDDDLIVGLPNQNSVGWGNLTFGRSVILNYPNKNRTLRGSSVGRQ